MCIGVVIALAGYLYANGFIITIALCAMWNVSPRRGVLLSMCWPLLIPAALSLEVYKRIVVWRTVRRILRKLKKGHHAN